MKKLKELIEEINKEFDEIDLTELGILIKSEEDSLMIKSALLKLKNHNTQSLTKILKWIVDELVVKYTDRNFLSEIYKIVSSEYTQEMAMANEKTPNERIEELFNNLLSPIKSYLKELEI